jgi:hypothetical protein
METLNPSEVLKLENEIFVTIASSQMEEPITFKTSAQTLGELKKVLDEQGIDYANQTFQEGVTVTQLLNDSTMLPRYKGDKKLDALFIMMTGTKKKITSGGPLEDRRSLVARATAFGKAHPEYAAEFKSINNKKSADIIALLAKYDKKAVSDTIPTPTKKEDNPAITKGASTISNGQVLSTLGYLIFSSLAEFCKNIPLDVEKKILNSAFKPEQIEEFKRILAK